MEQLLIILLVALIASIIFLIISLRKQSKTSSELIERKINEALRLANNELIQTAQRTLEADKREISVDLKNKKEEINRLVELIREDLKDSKDKLSISEQERIKSFSALKESLEEYKKITKELSITTDGLKKILSDNQLRGQFGEQVAEDLLKMSGFTKGIDYDTNIKQNSSPNRPDFIVYLPDKTKINVDVKFPFNNLQKMSETSDAGEKKQLLKAFKQDVKIKIKQVSTRDYINPEDKTVDFVILFIPNEMIFSFIYDKMPDIWKEAMEKKVILAGPFSFTAILRMVRQAYQYFSFQKNLQTILQNVQAFSKEFGKFNDEFQKIGTKIESLSKQYSTVSTTRYNKLIRTIDKIETRLDKKDIPSDHRDLLE